MALVLVDAPVGGLLYAAYVSQTFIVTETVTTGQPPAALEVVVKNNGVELETLYYEAIEISSGGGTDTCTFKLDIREVVQQVFTPRDMLPLYADPFATVQEYPDEVAVIQCDFISWKPNADNFLIRENESLETSLAYRVINAVRYEDEDPSLQAFWQATERRFLTSKPLRGWTDLATSEYLYMYNRDDIDITWWFEFRSSIGLLLSGTRKNAAVDNENTILRIGIGGLNVLNTSWDQTILGGGGHGLLNPNVHYYEVYGTPAGSTDEVTERRRYYVKRPSETCISYRIHFLNRYGVWDFFPVQAQPGDNLNLSDDPYERTMPDDFIGGSAPIYRAHVRNRGQVRADKGFEVEVSKFSPNAAVWLQELVMSPLAFVERPPADSPTADGRFYPVVIQSKDFDITERTFTLEVIYSKQKFSQRV